MRRLFVSVSQIHQSLAIVRGEEFHHLCHVLRLRVGDQVSLRDDSGREHHGVIASLSSTAAEITIIDTTQPVSTRVSLTLALGLLKGQKMDLVIEKATELGVDRIMPFTSTFTVSQLPTERLNDRLSRWQRVAQSAAKQSGSIVPQVLTPVTLEEVCTTQSSDTTSILLYEREHAQAICQRPSTGLRTVRYRRPRRWICSSRSRPSTASRRVHSRARLADIAS
jgi:16S rRNA (uracil1498-N3)-methyltransferase